MSINPSWVNTHNNVSTTFNDRIAITLPEYKKGLIRAFHANTKFAPRSMVQTVTNAPSARFRSSWKATAEYHTPGVRLLGMTPPGRNFREIFLDDRLVSHHFIDYLDIARGLDSEAAKMFGEEQGHALAAADETNTAIIACLAARAAANITGADTGFTITESDVGTNISVLNAALWTAKNQLDIRNVNPNGRMLALRPSQYNLLAANMDRMFNRQLGQSSGSFGGNVVIPDYAGFQEIFMSNYIPSTSVSTPAGARNTYAGDFTKTVAVGFHSTSFGTVRSGSLEGGGSEQPSEIADTSAIMEPVSSRVIEIPDALGYLKVASLVTGHGICNPVGSFEIVIP